MGDLHLSGIGVFAASQIWGLMRVCLCYSGWPTRIWPPCKSVAIAAQAIAAVLRGVSVLYQIPWSRLSCVVDFSHQARFKVGILSSISVLRRLSCDHVPLSVELLWYSFAVRARFKALAATQISA